MENLLATGKEMVTATRIVATAIVTARQKQKRRSCLLREGQTLVDQISALETQVDWDQLREEHKRLLDTMTSLQEKLSAIWRELSQLEQEVREIRKKLEVLLPSSPLKPWEKLTDPNTIVLN